jgi:hypothetical protein
VPSAIPARDASVAWPVHTCSVRHAAGAACPPFGVWLADWVASDPARERVTKLADYAKSRNTNGPRAGLAIRGAGRS